MSEPAAAPRGPNFRSSLGNFGRRRIGRSREAAGAGATWGGRRGKGGWLGIGGSGDIGNISSGNGGSGVFATASDHQQSFWLAKGVVRCPFMVACFSRSGQCWQSVSSATAFVDRQFANGYALHIGNQKPGSAATIGVGAPHCPEQGKTAMARSTCPKCDNTRFEVKVVTPNGSNFKLQFVQCSVCGAVVGVLERLNLGSLLILICRQLGIRLP